MKAKGLFLIVFSLLFSTSRISQAQNSKQTDNSVYSVVEQMPDFPGGQEAMNKFIQGKIV